MWSWLCYRRDINGPSPLQWGGNRRVYVGDCALNAKCQQKAFWYALKNALAVIICNYLITSILFQDCRQSPVRHSRAILYQFKRFLNDLKLRLTVPLHTETARRRKNIVRTVINEHKMYVIIIIILFGIEKH